MPTASPPPDDASVAQRYRLEQEIGRGGMGVVYRAHDTLLDRPVAVKLLHGIGLEAESRARLLREARAVASLEHPNIVTIYDAGEARESDGAPYIVMQLVRGQSLRDQPPRTLDETLAVARQVCAALDHAHAHGLVHRDLKPGNVLITPDGAAKLVDFGLARSSDSRLTATGAIVGTVHYLAPEQALGKEVDGRADLYALGVMLYELACGRLPFTADDPVAVVVQHLYSAPEPPTTHNPAIPATLEAIILRLLAKEPGERFATAGEVLRALAGIGSTAAEPRHNLPADLTSFIGRVREIEAVKGLLASSRLTTLIGTGGSGKTRLALETARRSAPGYLDGAWLVELAPLADAALVPQVVASTLGVREVAGRTAQEALIDHLQGRHLLLILDNCEHVIESCARLAEALLRAAPNVSILATSREAMQIGGEAAYPVPTLDVPPEAAGLEALPSFEAARLFVERAASALPGFALTSANAAGVAEVCRRLDGIPLALELAAVRVRMLSVEQIAGRLDDRFGLLTGGSRTALPRHRTLRATVDWSYELLSEPERALMRRLSVFAGGWSLAAAEYVTGDGSRVAGASSLATLHASLAASDIVELLSQLVNKSLVVVATLRPGDEAGGESEARYRLLETIRQYAAEKLNEAGEAAETRERHLDYFLSMAEQSPTELGISDMAGLRRLTIEQDNMRAALDWAEASEGGALKGLRLAAALSWFWHTRSDSTEGRRRLTAALARPEAQAPTLTHARALAAAAELAYRQTDLSAAGELYKASQAIFRDLGPSGRAGMVHTLAGLGEVATEFGDYVKADALFEEGLALARELEDARLVGNMLIQLGWSALRTGRFSLAATRLAEAQVLFTEIRHHWGMAAALSGQGEVSLRQGNYERAIGFLSESAALSRQLGNKWGLGTVLGTQAWAAQRQGDFDSARELLAESIRLREEIGDKGGTAWCLERLAEMAAADGRAALAVQTEAAAAALRASVGSVIDPADQPEHERRLAALRAVLGDSAFEAAWAEGQKLEMKSAVEQALAGP